MAKSQKSASVKPVAVAQTASTKPVKQTKQAAAPSIKPAAKQSESAKPTKQSAKPAAKPAAKVVAAAPVAPVTPVEPSHLDAKQVTQGLHALYTLIARSEDNKSKATLIDKDPFIYLQLTLKRVPAKQTNVPIRVPVKNTLYGDDCEICVITKDNHEDIDAYMAAHPVAGITKFLSLKDLHAQYGRHNEKRELLAMYDLFLADERVLPLLPRLLGGKFFEKKKQPAPVKLKATHKDRELKKAMQSTYMFISTGPVMQIRIARCSFSRQETADNINLSINKIVNKIPGKWSNIQSIQVRTADSLSIPLYNSLPLQDVGEFEDEDEDIQFDAEVESEEEPEPVKPVAKGKGKKRAAQEISEPEVAEPVKPVKQAKQAKQAKQQVATPAEPAAPVAAPQSNKKQKVRASTAAPTPVAEPVVAAPQSAKKAKAARPSTTPAPVVAQPAPVVAQPEATPSKKQQKVRPSTTEQPQSAKKQKTATIEEPVKKAPATPNTKGRATPAGHVDTPHPTKSEAKTKATPAPQSAMKAPKSGKKGRASVAAQ